MSNTNFLKEFVTGINLAWLDGQYDHDFGTNQTRNNDMPQGTLKVAYPDSKLNYESYIKDISSVGVKVVRLWLFERFEGLAFGHGGHVIGPTSDIFYNLRDACKIAKKHGVKFYFCLMDTWGITSSDLPDLQKKQYLEIINGLITTKDKRKSFLDAAIDVLSDDIIKKSVWAVDVLNEPEGLERNKILNDRGIDTKIVWSQLIEYIQDACTKIKQKTGHPTSCGFQDSNNLIKFKNQLKNAVDFYDFHVYNDTGSLPKYTDLNLDKPCVIGECGQSNQNVDNNLQRNVVKNFLEHSKKLQYSGCMIWEYGYKNNTTEKRHSLIS